MKGIDYREDPDGFIYHDIQALFVISHVQFCLVLATLELDSDINYLFGGNLYLGDSLSEVVQLFCEKNKFPCHCFADCWTRSLPADLPERENEEGRRNLPVNNE